MPLELNKQRYLVVIYRYTHSTKSNIVMLIEKKNFFPALLILFSCLWTNLLSFIMLLFYIKAKAKLDLVFMCELNEKAI